MDPTNVTRRPSSAHPENSEEKEKFLYTVRKSGGKNVPDYGIQRVLFRAKMRGSARPM